MEKDNDEKVFKESLNKKGVGAAGQRRDIPAPFY